MKKALSLFLAVIMAFSVFSGMSVSANTVTVESISYKSAAPAVLTEYDPDAGFWSVDDNDNDFYFYDFWSTVQVGDSITVNYSDGKKDVYTYMEYNYDYDFYNSDGEWLSYDYDSEQYASPWGIGEHYFTITVGDCEATLPVTIIESPVASIEYIPLNPIEIIEKDFGAGYWEEIGLSKFFYYSFWDIVNPGDVLKVNMKDGTTINYTLTEYDEDDDGYYDINFVDENGIDIQFNFDDNQWETHWGLGNHWFTIEYFGCTTKMNLTIVANPYKDFSYTPVKSIIMLQNDADNGHWARDRYDKDFYYYEIPIFRAGDVLTATRKDGTVEKYTFVITQSGSDWDDGAFLDSSNKHFPAYIAKESDQETKHWTLGSGTNNYFKIMTLGMEKKVPVTIIENPVCNHLTEWKNVNGTIQAVCKICKKSVSKLPFTDIANYASYGDYITYTSINNKFINGTNPPKFTLFSPTTAITRAMFVTILYRMAGSPYDASNPHKTSPFTDITDKTVYYYNSACWALDNGITTQTTFKPNDLVVREQTASFLFRYADSAGLIEDDYYKYVDLESYPDYNSVSSWAVTAMKWANWNGMITGTQQGTLNPKGSTLRIHATKILYGFGITCEIGNL